jgi:uncharacterized membrane protein YGL010W
MALMSDRSMDDWVAQYELSHRHPVNRACHTFGIPLIASSVLGAVPALFVPVLWWPVGAAFGIGWGLQFLGHAVEGKPPEFLRDWRFLFVGLRWWLRKVGGRPMPAAEP